MNQPENNNFRKKWTNPVPSYIERQNFANWLVITVSFIVMTIVMCVGMIPEQASWQIGTTASRTIQADRSIVYEDEEATNEKINQALAELEPVYQVNLEQFNNLTLVAIDRAFDLLRDDIITEDGAAITETTATDESAAVTDTAEAMGDSETGGSATLTESGKQKKSKLEDDFNFMLDNDAWLGRAWLQRRSH